MKMLLLATTGGAIGAGARHLVNLGVGRMLGTNFPWATLTVNVVGSFLMGVLIEALILRYSSSVEMRTFLGTGILGGFTTFSAFSLDIALLLGRKEHGLAMLYIAASVCVSLAMLYAGMAATRAALS